MNTDITITPVKTLVEESKSVFSSTDLIYDGVFGRTISRWTLLLPGSGCAWARKKHKGCSFCAFNDRIDEVTGGRLIPFEEMMDFFHFGLGKIGAAEPNLLSLFNGGNFINNDEIVEPAQMAILEFAQHHPTLEKVLFESKLEYLSNRKLEACLKAIGNKKIRIGIGLECKDDYLRNVIINKGLSKEAYEKTLKRLKSMGIEVQSYVFMKPYSVTEKKAIQEAIDTVEYAIDCGSDIVMLEAAMVQKGTAFEIAYNKGEFRSPWLWSIKEVVNRVEKYPQFNVGIFDEEPKPISYPKNCDHCTDRFNQAFHVFRQTHESLLLKQIECECRSQWENVIRS
ncbi:MAG: hypothetical protein ACKVQC_06685 [Elusimicrobiota bacterium]